MLEAEEGGAPSARMADEAPGGAGPLVADLDALAWSTGDVVDHEGTAFYAHLVRAAGDPERGDIRLLPEPLRDRVGAWRRSLSKTKPEEHKAAILALLADGVPRTFNRIGVELWDKTADVLFQMPPDFALWELVGERKVEHTLEVPILFRLVDTAR